MYKLKNLFEFLHFPLWILKDSFWYMKLGTLSAIFALPTILISIALINWTVDIKQKENIILFFWLCANTFWMLSELFLLPTDILAFLFFISGLIISLKTLPDVIKRFKEE